MKKKRVAGILAVVAVLMIGATSVFAAEPNNRKNYVDADRDGVCDNYAVNCEANEKTCPNYVDEDKDGVCDNYAVREQEPRSEETGRQNGQGGARHRQHQGQHHGQQRQQGAGRCGVNKR